MQVIRVWRPTGQPDFTFDHKACIQLCRLYQQALDDNAIPRPYELGGTAYFNTPAVHAVIGRNETPYAAAVIRHAWGVLGLTPG